MFYPSPSPLLQVSGVQPRAGHLTAGKEKRALGALPMPWATGVFLETVLLVGSQVGLWIQAPAPEMTAWRPQYPLKHLPGATPSEGHVIGTPSSHPTRPQRLPPPGSVILALRGRPAKDDEQGRPALR